MQTTPNRYKFKWLDTDGNWDYRTLKYDDRAGLYLSDKQPNSINSPNTFCQCTGITDANGADIYEGDVVYIAELDCVVTVVWLDGCWFVKYSNDNGDYEPLQDVYNICVVVGNIHDKEATQYD